MRSLAEKYKAKEASDLAEKAEAVEKKKSAKKSTPRPREPEGIANFPKGCLVDLYWGDVWGWRGPYAIKSGLRYANTLVKIVNPLTGSHAFVSQNRLRKNQITKFQ